ncbi:MAG: glycosyltransferase family 4 protein [Vicinamibacterales bacterium]
MRLNLCLVNVPYSGSNAHLIRELGARVDLQVVDVPIPKVADHLAKLRTFHPDTARWRARYYEARAAASKSRAIFEQRSRIAARAVAGLPRKPDVLLQIGGMFSPEGAGIPYATFNDFTMALAIREYRPWAPFLDESSAQAWLEVETRLYRKASRVFTLSEHTRRSMLSDYGVTPEAAHAVGAGANFAAPPAPHGAYDCKSIVFVGIDFERKGGVTVLEAFRRVREVRPDVELFIAGPELSITQPGVTSLGRLSSRDQLLELYQRSSLFVMPSLCEPFGFVFLEAMMCGLPCIGSTNDAMPEIIEHGRTGCVVPPNDPPALAEAILAMLADPARLSEMGRQGRKRAQERFSWALTADRMTVQLENILAERDAFGSR